MAISVEDAAFIEAAYEIAFGDDAIVKGYTHEEVLAKLREFSDNALTEEEKDNGKEHTN